MWVASVSGGIWKTLNSGTSWNPVADFMANLNVTTMVLDPDHPDILFAGTGEGFSNTDALRGAGIFMSRDGGANWTQLPATTGPDYYYVNRVALSPYGKVLTAATLTGLFFSTAANETDPAKITFNAAKGPIVAPVLDLRYHPTDNALCVAGGQQGRAYYSTDGGENWKPATGLPPVPPGPFGIDGRVEVTYARANPRIVYASVNNNMGELYRSDDGGQNYVLKNAVTKYMQSDTGSQGWYDNLVWAGARTTPIWSYLVASIYSDPPMGARPRSRSPTGICPPRPTPINTP